MTLRSRLAVEDGVIAVLYGLCMSLMMGLLALAIDLSALKFDRRATQVTADLSATAGALSLLTGPGGGSPLKACDTAWGYIAVNLPEIPNSAPSPCASDGWTDTSTCTSPPPPADDTVGPFYVKIIWPVSDTSPYMQSRLDPDIDGDQCDRIAVHVSRTRSFIFGTLLTSATQSGTGGPAVARAKIDEGDTDAAALVVLDPFGCKTVRGTGSSDAGVHVWEAPGGKPGIISVDSDGRDCSGSTVIRFNGNNAQVKAGVIDTAGTVRKGYIYRFADQPLAYDPQDVTDGQLVGGNPVPRHPVKSGQHTRAPFEWRYDCRASYNVSNLRPHVAIDDCPEYDPAAPTAKSYINNLRSLHGSGPAPAGFTDYKAWFNTLFPTVDACDVSGDPDGDGVPGWALPPGSDWWIDCSTLKIRPGATFAIPDGNVVITGSAGDAIDLQGTLSVNAVSTEENYIFVRQGAFKKTAGAGLVLGNPDALLAGTFMLLNDGHIDFAGNGSAVFTWISPKFPGGPFEDLALWSESTTDHQLSGDVSNLAVEGTFYMPNALFDFAGGGAMGQQKAQFVAYRLWAHGGGFLRMVPDPDRMTPQYFPAVDLIR